MLCGNPPPRFDSVTHRNLPTVTTDDPEVTCINTARILCKIFSVPWNNDGEFMEEAGEVVE